MVAIGALASTAPALGQDGEVISVRACIERGEEESPAVGFLPDVELVCGKRERDIAPVRWNLAVQVTTACSAGGDIIDARPGVTVAVRFQRRQPRTKVMCRFDEAVDRKTWRLPIREGAGPRRARTFRFYVDGPWGRTLRGRATVARLNRVVIPSRRITQRQRDDFFNVCIRRGRDIRSRNGVLYCVEPGETFAEVVGRMRGRNYWPAPGRMVVSAAPVAAAPGGGADRIG